MRFLQPSGLACLAALCFLQPSGSVAYVRRQRKTETLERLHCAE